MPPQRLAALVTLFERYWDDTVPLDVDDSGPAGGGVTGKAVATRWGLSRRTAQCHIQRMTHLAWRGARAGARL
ncbi:hypothetical protein ACIOKD_38415 [Streptomyces sp. NPDC087844]|uniref:hypothetical protein n=1 Tax=Streptomyces sp. NPDC087844 TaxID=3365805 RepID=UPI0038143780